VQRHRSLREQDDGEGEERELALGHDPKLLKKRGAGVGFSRQRGAF
jgi:hypothetical protein